MNEVDYKNVKILPLETGAHFQPESYEILMINKKLLIEFLKFSNEWNFTLERKI